MVTTRILSGFWCFSCTLDPAKAESDIPSSEPLLIKLSKQNALQYFSIPLLKNHLTAVILKCVLVYCSPLPLSKPSEALCIKAVFYKGTVAANEGDCSLVYSNFRLSSQPSWHRLSENGQRYGLLFRKRTLSPVPSISFPEMVLICKSTKEY